MTGPTGADFQPEEVLRLLDRHRVRYVLIGGLAAILHGSPSVTRDIDVCTRAIGRTSFAWPRRFVK